MLSWTNNVGESDTLQMEDDFEEDFDQGRVWACVIGLGSVGVEVNVVMTACALSYRRAMYEHLLVQTGLPTKYTPDVQINSFYEWQAYFEIMSEQRHEPRPCHTGLARRPTKLTNDFVDNCEIQPRKNSQTSSN